MNSESYVLEQIDGYEEGIRALHADISLATDADTESFLWHTISDYEAEIARLRKALVAGDVKNEQVLYGVDVRGHHSPTNRLVVLDLIADLKRELSKRPTELYNLTPRRFEELIHSLLTDFGYDCQLTPQTRDGGCDIYANLHTVTGSFLLLVECKLWSPSNHVGIDIVQRVNGVRDAVNAHKAMIVTTSFFTQPAIHEQRKIAAKLDLADYEVLKAWLRTISSK